MAESGFRRLAQRQRTAVLVVGLLAVGARLAVMPILPVPEPNASDEFSYLLAAETFAQGRLTNPTPVMWMHFQTLHVLEQPTYMSMYPPAEGLFLAAGLRLTGAAFAGVLLSVGLMCAVICWMLQGWFSPGWALLGGLLAVVRFDVFCYWGNSYWGGAPAALGGALVLGALPRIVRWARARDAAWMGVGLALLANSRPYEGLVLSLPVAAALLAWLWGKRKCSLGRAMLSVVLPLAIVLALAGAWTGYYFWRVTGSPFRMPQQVEREENAVAPYFLWGSERPVPVYHLEALRHFYLHDELSFYVEGRTPEGLAGIEFSRALDFWLFYLGPAFTLPLLVALALLPHGMKWTDLGGRARFLLAASAISTAGIAAEVYFFPHYAAPMTGLVLAVVILAMRRVRAWRWRGRPTGRFFSRAVPVVCLLMLAIRAAAVPFHLPITPDWPPTAYNSAPIHSHLMEMQKRLESYPGQHLVIVHYSPEQKSHAGFVHNEADIEHAKVIWAWDMGAEENEKLIRRYKNRDVWLLDPMNDPPRLLPYSAAAAGAVK